MPVSHLTPLRRTGDQNLDFNFQAIQRAWTQVQGGLEYIWPDGYPASKLPLHVDTDGTVTEETVGSAGIADGSIIAAKLTENSLGLTSNIVFAANDYRTVGWSSGTITFANGTSYTIDAGNTGNMTADTIYYIYLDVDTSSTVLQVSTTFSDCVGDRKALMCVANSNGATDEEPFFVPRVGEVMIASGNISAKAIKAAQIDVASLSAIAADVGTLTAGIIQDAGANQQIILSGSPSASIYIDLSATGTDSFLAHTALSLLADGTADFSGVVSAQSFTATQIAMGPDASPSSNYSIYVKHNRNIGSQAAILWASSGLTQDQNNGKGWGFLVDPAWSVSNSYTGLDEAIALRIWQARSSPLGEILGNGTIDLLAGIYVDTVGKAASSTATITDAYGIYVNAPVDGTNRYAGAFEGAVVKFAQTQSGYASIRLPHGTAPTSPQNGDVWTTTAGLYVRINGSTVGPLTA